MPWTILTGHLIGIFPSWVLIHVLRYTVREENRTHVEELLERVVVDPGRIAVPRRRVDQTLATFQHFQGTGGQGLNVGHGEVEAGTEQEQSLDVVGVPGGRVQGHVSTGTGGYEQPVALAFYTSLGEMEQGRESLYLDIPQPLAAPPERPGRSGVRVDESLEVVARLGEQFSQGGARSVVNRRAQSMEIQHLDTSRHRIW